MELVTEWSMLDFRVLMVTDMPFAIEECGISETSTSASMLAPPERKGRPEKGDPSDKEGR
jgi:hypothetical protein